MLIGAGISKMNAQFILAPDAFGTPNICEYTYYGNGISFYDFNNDGLDDITLGNGLDSLRFFQNDVGVLEELSFNLPLNPTANIQTVLWADYDNDGDPDLLTSQYGGPLQLWQNDGDFNFVDFSSTAGLQAGNWDWWGSSFADYDHDGFLDLYAAKYYAQPGDTSLNKQGILYHNNGDGTFSNVTTESGVELITQAIFQPVWFDYDNDGWEDLYLVIDRLIWPNRLFRNNHDGTFTDVSEESGLGVLMNSMSGTVGDFDNDHDLDIYVTNTSPYNYLFRNNGDLTYSIITEEAGVLVENNSWGACWMDCNNNGWDDLFVGTTGFLSGSYPNHFYLNNTDTTFQFANTAVGLGADFAPTFVCASGDVNHDGYVDFATNNNDPHPTDLWLNFHSGQHFISATLEGVIANRDGVGSWITCYTDEQTLTKYTQCGENMLGQNSRKEFFGLGQTTTVDSLRIEWNSGTVDMYYDLAIDEHYFFEEGNGYCTHQPCSCPADFTMDYQVTTADLLVFLSAFGCTTECTVDLDGDGNTGTSDLLLYLSFHGGPCD